MQVICLVGLSDTWIKAEVQSEGKKEVFKRIETRLDSQKHKDKSISSASWCNSEDASKRWTNSEINLACILWQSPLFYCPLFFFLSEASLQICKYFGVTLDRGWNKLAKYVFKPILCTGMLLGGIDSLPHSLLGLVSEFRNGKGNQLRAERGNPHSYHFSRK